MKPYTPRLTVTDDCHGCGVCVSACRREAISMRVRGPSEGDGAPAAEIDQALCNVCRACLDTCPVEAIREPYPPEWREGAAG